MWRVHIIFVDEKLVKYFNRVTDRKKSLGILRSTGEDRI
jgi:hypothetical protein